VLRRRVGEAILVSGEVEIEVLEISRSRVKLGIRAPFKVSVVRRETLPVARENQLASDLVADLVTNQGKEGLGELVRLLQQPAAAREPAFPPDTGESAD
jgi:carbon storage regulator